MNTLPKPQVLSWEEVKHLYRDLSPEVQEMVRGTHEKWIAAIQRGSKTPILDSFEGLPENLRSSLLENEWIAPLVAEEMAV